MAAADADAVLLMDPHVMVIQPGWLDQLTVCLQDPAVAIAAPRLVSGDNRVLNGGIVLGGGARAVGAIAHSGLTLDDPGYMGRALVSQQVSAVSSTCMLVRKSVLASIQAPGDTLTVELYRAVDYCLQATQDGGRIVWTPHSTLLYVEGVRGNNNTSELETAVREESEALCKRWLPRLANDPVYNPNLCLPKGDYSIEQTLIAPARDQDREQQRILAYGTGSYGAWQYRVAQPVGCLHEQGLADALLLPFEGRNKVHLPTVTELERLQADVLLLHNAVHDEGIEAMRLYKRINGAFIVFGEDDLVTALPSKNPFAKTIYRDMKKRLRQCLSLADRLVVTTEPLAEALRDMVDEVRVVPNYLDVAVWGELCSQRSLSARPRVGWAGAQQHQGDLELLEAVVRGTANEVDWVFFGMCPQALRPYVKEVHEAVSFEDYPRKLASLNLDLAVAPLEHNRFNECKSNLRILEYGMLGWPVIASDIEPYRDAPVCRVINKPDAWIKAIREHVSDLDETCREGDILRDWVRSNWLLEQHLSEWMSVLSPTAPIVGQKRPDQMKAL